MKNEQYSREALLEKYLATGLTPEEIEKLKKQRATGEWIHGCTNGPGTEYCYCSECTEDALYDRSGFREFTRFCPHCGRPMKNPMGW